MITELWRRYGQLPALTRWGIAGAWYGVIFLLSGAPGTDSETTQGWLDLWALGGLNGLLRMAAHGFMFGVQAILVHLALAGHETGRARRAAGGALGITFVLAVLDELHQHFVPLRHGRAVDVVFDMAGAGMAMAALLLWTARHPTDNPGEDADGGTP